jgi:hypothetical protein
MSNLRTIIQTEGGVTWWEVYLPHPLRVHGRRILAEGCSNFRWTARLAARRARRRIERGQS